MITGTMTSHRDDTKARIWTLTVPEAPRPGQLIEWSEPACGSIPAREGIRGWVLDSESTKPGTVVVQVAAEGTRWVIVKVEDQAPEAEADPAPCLRRNAHEPHDTPRGRCPGTAPEYPSEAVERVADVTEAPAPAPVNLFRADWPYPEITAADFAALYSTAAEIIKARGYYAYEVQGYADEPGVSITGALKAAALEHAQAADPQDRPEQHYRTAQDLTEELETRLSAVLYILGPIHSRTGIRDLSDMHVGWSLGHFELGPIPPASHALALLEQAAGIFRALADQAAPVTEAPEVPAPSRPEGARF